MQTSQIYLSAFVHVHAPRERNALGGACAFARRALSCNVHTCGRRTSPGLRICPLGGMLAFANCFNRIEQASKGGEDHALTNNEEIILQWNEVFTDFMSRIAPISDARLADAMDRISDTIANTFKDIDNCRRLGDIEKERLRELMSYADVDGDGIIDDPIFLKDISTEGRIIRLDLIMAKLCHLIFLFCKTHKICLHELNHMKMIPPAVNLLSTLCNMDSDESRLAICDISRLLVLITLDDRHIAPLAGGPKGFASLWMVHCKSSTLLNRRV